MTALQGSANFCLYAGESFVARDFAGLFGPGTRLICGAETSLPPHANAHSLTHLVNELEGTTIQIQHGFDVPGLTYFDQVHTPDIEIASANILLWGAKPAMPSALDEGIRKRRIEAGRFMMPKSISDGFDYDVAIFENLHWHLRR